mmetsp:Transcript_9914/g.21160  ORF Transcript_9914/g.21160 Transcript_9914/m.21160 type:complete len:244 (+) Transcript_9914:1358-2089(+)
MRGCLRTPKPPHRRQALHWSRSALQARQAAVALWRQQLLLLAPRALWTHLQGCTRQVVAVAAQAVQELTTAAQQQVQVGRLLTAPELEQVTAAVPVHELGHQMAWCSPGEMGRSSCCKKMGHQAACQAASPWQRAAAAAAAAAALATAHRMMTMTCGRCRLQLSQPLPPCRPNHSALTLPSTRCTTPALQRLRAQSSSTAAGRRASTLMWTTARGSSLTCLTSTCWAPWASSQWVYCPTRRTA